MTIAICVKCGEFKFGAFAPCPKCLALPKSEDEHALSLMLTDHFLDQPTLETMGVEIKRGNPPSLDPETREELIQELRDFLPNMKSETQTSDE